MRLKLFILIPLLLLSCFIMLSCNPTDPEIHKKKGKIEIAGPDLEDDDIQEMLNSHPKFVNKAMGNHEEESKSE